MKRSLLFSVLLWMGLSTMLYAQPRSTHELDSIANSVFLNSRTRSFVSTLELKYTSSQVLKTTPSVHGESFYIFAPIVEEHNNYVIVSGDKRMPAILGYSATNKFDVNNIPEGLRWFLEKCNADVAMLNEQPQEMFSVVPTFATSAINAVVSPLLGNRIWNQGKPFNNQCPEVSTGVRAVTGCTATAMAQVMAYHQYPQKGTGNISYTTPTYGYSVKANLNNAAAYSWNYMLDSYEDGYSEAQANAVAQLMFHVAAAITTDFSESASGAATNSPEKALITHFGYDDGIRIVRSSDCVGEVWHSLLQQELLSGRPVLVSGFDENTYSGHAFVFDGLDADGYYHVNWGWSGLCDGYYNVYNLVPEETGIGGGFGDYSYSCQAVIGISPEDGKDESEPTNIVVERATSANGLGIFNLNKSISLNLNKFINMRYLTFKGDAQLMLTDAVGQNVVAMLGSPLAINTLNGLPQGSYIENISLSASLPADIGDGDYRLYVAVRQSGYDQWGKVRAYIADVAGRHDYYELSISDGKYTLGPKEYNPDDDAPGDVGGEDALTTIGQIRNDQAYTISCERGVLGIQNGKLVATSRDDITLEANQFVLYKYNEIYYLYNLENESFVGLDDNETEGDRYASLTATSVKANISLGYGYGGDYPFTIKFNDLWLNVYEGYTPGLVINNYDALDEGNQFKLVPAGEVTVAQQESIKERIEETQKESIILTTILPLGTEQAWESKYRFTENLNDYTEPALDTNGRNWKELNYDDSNWPTLTGPMVGGYSYPIVNFEWAGIDNCFELRRKFHLDSTPQGIFTFSVRHDDAVWVYLNGVLVMSETNWTTSFEKYQIPTEAFVQGENILAIHTEQYLGDTFLDYTLYNEKLPEIYTDDQGVKYQTVNGSSMVSVIGHGKVYKKDIVITDEVMGYVVTGISSGAFADVDDITSVTMLLERPYAIPEDAFSESVYQNAALIVPYGYEDVYKTTAGWGKFANITYFAPDEYTDEQGVIYALNEDGETYMVKGYTENLKSKIVLPETLHGKDVTVIGDYAFIDAHQLKEISLFEGILHIGDFSFVRTSLSEIIVPNSVTAIENSAFADNQKLEKAHLGSGVEFITSNASFYHGHNSFQNCPQLREITVDENNKYFSSYNGMLYDKAQMILCAVPGGKTSLQESDFSKNVSMIASYAAVGARLTEVVLPSTVSIAEEGCFQGCDKLISFTVKSHAIDFRPNTFDDCMLLEHLFLYQYYPDKNLGDSYFFENVNSGVIVHVPKGLEEVYKSKISEGGHSVTIVGDVEFTQALDVDYSLGYNKVDMLIGLPEVGFKITKEQIDVYKGCKIKSIQVHLANFDNSEFTAYVSTRPGGEKIIQSIMPTVGFNGWRKIVFDEPYMITGTEDELFVGFVSGGSGIISYSGINVPENVIWYNYYGNWQPWSGEGLAISYTLEGDNIPAHIRMMDVVLVTDEYGYSHVKGKLESCALGVVDGFDVAYSIDGGTTVTTHVDMSLAPKQLYDFDIVMPSDVPSGKHMVDVWMAKVGDMPDAFGYQGKSSVTLVGQEERYSRKVVVEEGAGTWCGYCPRGIVGMRTMMQNHPDNFIPIVVHEDEMTSPSYSEIFGLLGGSFPSCTMNRKHFFDPNAADLEKYYQQEVNQADARIDMVAQWADEEKTKVLVKTISRFAYDMTDDYRIAYAVTENGVGPYPQANYFGGGEEMGGFEKEQSVVSILHNHVARSISSLNGERGSVPSQPKGLTDYEYSYTLNLPDNIDNKENIQLVVLLINQQTGEIVNADNVDVNEINPYDPTFIHTEMHERFVDVYSLQGVLIKQQIPVGGLENELPSGVYIVNGKKVVIND